MKHIKMVGRFCIVIVALIAIFLRPGGIVHAAPQHSCQVQKPVLCPHTALSTSNTAIASYLNDVKAVSAHDVWSVGQLFDPTNNTSQTLIDHWIGSHWSIIPSPNPGGPNSENFLSSVAALASNNVWAVGWYSPNANTDSQTLIEHWDGSAWHAVSSPSVSGAANVLQHVTAISPNDIWAAGWFTPDNSASQTLIERWDGSSWTIVLSPNAGSIGNGFYGITALASNDIWAIGIS